MTVDLAARTTACLAAAARPRGPSTQWIDAIRRVQDGDGVGAGEALQPLDDGARVVCTEMLERLAVRLGLSDAAVQAIGAPLTRDLKPKALTFDATGWMWNRGWTDEVTAHVGADRLKGNSPHGHDAARKLLDAVKAACARGDQPGAEALAAAIDPYHKDTRSRAWCAVAAWLPPGSEADERWTRAVKDARRSPMIQDGAEESEALADVVESLALRLPAEHPAVVAAVGALRQLGKTRAPRDARGTGICRAATHLARRAAAAGERATPWIEHAEALLRCNIDGGGAAWSAFALLALAHRARGDAEAEQASLSRITDAVFHGVPEVRAMYPERTERLVRHWNVGATAFGEVGLIRDAGGDASGRLEAAIRSACIYKWGAERAYGQLIAIAHAESPRAPWLERPRGPIEARALDLLTTEVEDRADALADAAHSLLWVDEDAARAWYRAALDAGFHGRWLVRDARWVQEPNVRDRVEAIALAEADVSDRSCALTDLADVWLRQGDVARALTCIGHLTAGPARDERPEWKPYSGMGDRAGWVPYSRPALPAEPPPPPAGALAKSTAAIKALKPSQRRDAWWELAQILVDRAELAHVRAQIAKGKEKGHIAFNRAWRLMELDLRLGEVDAALASAAGMDPQSDHVLGVATAAQRIAEWLLTKSAVTPTRVLAVIGLFAAAHWQWTAERALRVVPDLIEALPVGDREAALAAARAMPHNRVLGLAIEAVVCGRTGNPEGAARALRDALAVMATGHGELLATALAAAERDTPLPGRQELLDACLRRLTGATYQVCIALEHIARHLWLAGDTALLPARVRASGFPSEVKAAARRSLVVMAPEHAPRPVDAVLAAWSDDPPNLDQAREQAHALALALDREQRTDEAAAIRRLLGT